MYNRDVNKEIYYKVLSMVCMCIIYIHLRIIEMSRIRFIAWFYLSKIVVHTKYILLYNVRVEKIKSLFFLQHYVRVFTPPTTDSNWRVMTI